MLTYFDDYDLNITSDTRKAERSLYWHWFQFTCSMFLLPPRLLAPIANRDKRSFDSGLIFAITLGPVYSTLCSGNCCCLAPRNDTILCTSGAHRVQHVGHPAFTCDTSSEEKWNEGAVCSREAMETSWAIITLALYQMIPSNLPGRLQCPSCWGCFGYNANFCPGCSFLQNIWPFRSSDGSLLHCWHGRKGSDAYHKLYFHHHLRLNHNYINT